MGTRIPTFAELVGDEDEFFATYHTRRLLLRRGALAGDPREILSVADMDDIVHQEGVRPSLLRMLGQGTGVAAGRGYEGVAQRHFFTETAAVDHIDENTLVAGLPGAATVHEADTGTALVTVHGNKLRMPESTATALTAASGTQPFRAGDFLPGDSADRSLASVKQLIRLGALHVAGATRDNLVPAAAKSFGPSTQTP